MLPLLPRYSHITIVYLREYHTEDCSSAKYPNGHALRGYIFDYLRLEMPRLTI
jgi:hypothetical protein